jgi:hypothetical protein
LVEVFFLLPHASDDTQPLNLLALARKNPQSNQVMDILGVWFTGRASYHNAEAFMSLGLVPFRESNDCFLRVDRERVTRVRDWPRTSGGIPAVDLRPEAQRKTHLPADA